MEQVGCVSAINGAGAESASATPKVLICQKFGRNPKKKFSTVGN